MSVDPVELFENREDGQQTSHRAWNIEDLIGNMPTDVPSMPVNPPCLSAAQVALEFSENQQTRSLDFAADEPHGKFSSVNLTGAGTTAVQEQEQIPDSSVDLIGDMDDDGDGIANRIDQKSETRGQIAKKIQEKRQEVGRKNSMRNTNSIKALTSAMSLINALNDAANSNSSARSKKEQDSPGDLLKKKDDDVVTGVSALN
ncbi:MAG: hypothetical protein LBF42_01255 [Puniceicoccales bacterium]|jgi:hypothetical protein|nr:hypothetical protein [Puniceicoccales bacterium]